MTRRSITIDQGPAATYHVKLNTASLNPRPVEGFGGAFTAASGVNYKKLSDDDKRKFIELYFGQSGLRYTMGRIPINSCDFSPYTYNFDNVSDDFALEHFDESLKGDEDTGMIQLMHDALGKASLKLFGSPWSPPYWMKAGDHSMIGSANPCLKQDKRYKQAWADYFVKWIQSYGKKKIPIWGVTQQNEPQFYFNTRWEACSYDPANQTEFIRDYLGPTLNKTFGDKVKIMYMDYTKDHLMEVSDVVLQDSKAAQYIYGAGVHWYTFDQISNLENFKAKYGSKYALLGTEACTCDWDSGFFHNSAWQRAARYVHGVIVDFMHGGATGWVDWNLLLNEKASHANRGGPNHADNYCYAHIHIDNASQLVIQPSYYAFGHITKFIAPGARMVTSVNVTNSTSSPIFTINTLEAMAFVNEAKTELEIIVRTRPPTPYSRSSSSRTQ
ncbi:Glucosylceramidase precursor, putative [Perkinsus marinus ATCC 50983]|uniref:Glucosylceramidase, putative n=2 Tax=Perkinsus marinus (strain ATCC 50983 / TXsc) TaxID=423536 RepID=C5LK11_PERM5|nr:Glucosylceramidase precursor, putative [Perkinsus marinus ATCC 50983]EER02932.1 Glucosylceramidase precursor, putative [Perkinsus marinus ATCC 50983]|eukprot:XP_002771116.1 Glucosylceramidase precursor, putative [Perkinsus marinus ATCC 50983]